jgi:hypothetical protein
MLRMLGTQRWKIEPETKYLEYSSEVKIRMKGKEN